MADAAVRDRVIDWTPFHYGWVILVAGGLGAFMTTPGQTIGVSSFFDALAADLALSRSQVSLYYAVGTLAGILPAPFVGRWIDRRGPRFAGALIALAVALACGVMAFAWSAMTLMIAFAALRGTAVGALSLVSQHVINLWFVERRGIAAIAVSLGIATGAVVFPPAIEALLRAGGWRYAYSSLGLVVAATMIPVALLLFRERPERFGLTADLGAVSARAAARPEAVFTRAQAMRTPVFWSLSAANLLSNALGTGLILNHFDLLARAGIARETAALLFGPLAVTQVVMAVTMGTVVDRVPPQKLVALPMLAQVAACLMVGMLSSGSGALMYALTLGVALGSFQAIQAMVYAHHFGRTHAGEIRGVTFVITIVGAALGSLLFGVSSSHGYAAVLIAGAALCALTAAMNLVVRPPAREDNSHRA